MKYIYLDWNVIQYSKQLKNEGNIDESSFYGLVGKLSRKYYFPFSIAHLKDLATSIKKSNKGYIEEDLSFIKSFTNNCAITVDNETLKIIKTVDVYKEFEGVQGLIRKNKDIDLHVVCFGKSFDIDMSQVREDDLLKEFLEKNNGVLTPKVMVDFIKYISQEISDPKFYKKFRAYVSGLQAKYRKSHKSIVDQKSDYFKKIIPFFDFMLERDESKIFSTFNEAINAFLSIDGRDQKNMDKSQKIELAYSILDFNPSFYDKVTNSNRPSNIYNDIEHLYFASEANYYVTEDRANLKKSSLVAKLLFPHLKVLSMKEFQSKFC